MESSNEIIDLTIKQAEKLRSVLKKSTTTQVSSRDERDLAKATSMAWFNNHMPTIRAATGAEACEEANNLYHNILEYTDRKTTRSKYAHTLKLIKKELSNLRKHIVQEIIEQKSSPSNDDSPDFSSLIGDQKMQIILELRWKECVACIAAGAPLAATVMMGGFLETLLLSRFNQEDDKSKIFSAATAPIDRKSGKTLQLKEWTLRNYLDVGHELGWVSRSTKDVGEVVRDFRNYIHPYKQASHGVNLEPNDARLFWEICKEISRQLLS